LRLSGRLLSWAALVALLAGVPAAQARRARARSPGPPPPPATARLAHLESQLLHADTVRVRFSVSSPAEQLRGTLTLGPGGMAECEVGGTRSGHPVQGYLYCDGRRVRGEGQGQNFDLPAPPALRYAYVTGLARQGLRHNLERLAVGLLPDHCALADSAWLAAADTALAGRAGPGEVRFAVRVDGTAAGVARVRLDARTGLPVERRQQGADGETVETYAFQKAR